MLQVQRPLGAGHSSPGSPGMGQEKTPALTAHARIREREPEVRACHLQLRGRGDSDGDLSGSITPQLTRCPDRVRPLFARSRVTLPPGLPS